jgi:hypothetical protein
MGGEGFFIETKYDGDRIQLHKVPSKRLLLIRLCNVMSERRNVQVLHAQSEGLHRSLRSYAARRHTLPEHPRSLRIVCPSYVACRVKRTQKCP